MLILEQIGRDGTFTNVEKTGALWAGGIAATLLVGAAVGMLVQKHRNKELWKGATAGAITGVTVVPVSAIVLGIAASQGWIG